MLSKAEFVQAILDGTLREATASAAHDAAGIADGFLGFGDEADNASVTDTRFAQLLLEKSGFGLGGAVERDEIVLGDQRSLQFLPLGGIYWPKTVERPFHIVLFELEKTGSAVKADPFFRQTDQLEDALHRMVQDVLEGFERGGAARTADRKQGAQTETLCVISISDDRGSEPRQLVCFGTKCVATTSLEVFTLREEVRDWAARGDRPLAEEHLGQLYERHFKPLGSGVKWQTAFVSGAERKKAAALLAACRQPKLVGSTADGLLSSVRDLLDEIAWSFGIPRKKANENRCLDMVELPKNHSVAVDPDASRKPGYENPLRGARIYDSSERLLGFLVYVPESSADFDRLRQELRTHNHFHNVLVVYPGTESPELELWQGAEPLRGRLVAGTRRSRFDGEGGVVQLLSRFFVVGKSPIEKPIDLARELAWRARHLKALALEELARERAGQGGPLQHLYEVFNQALATLTPEQFADAYAQTITYGMLAARWLSAERDKLLFARKNLAELLPSTSPFLHDLFDKLVNSNFDKNLSWLLDDVTSLLARTSVAQVFLGEKDPSIHFYQDFLDAYDPQIRKDQGVYYTPDEVVSYIVRTAHSSLQDDFGLALGLADTTSWADFAKAKGLTVPDGVDPKEPFVQVLDPATGTGTFLLRVIEVIHETMTAEYARRGLDQDATRKAWTRYVRKELLPRINGFELMMAPYIVSHLRLGLALQETGFVFGKQDRLRVFLTNTLEMHTPSQLSLLGEHVAEEAKEAERAKKEAPISVIVGNPPYERESSSSGNKGGWILVGVDRGRPGIEDFDERTRATGAGGSIQATRNLYYYFWRWCIWRVFDRGVDVPGIVSLITASSYLRGPGFAGMRAYVRERCDQVYVLDLEGDQLGTRITSNVFEIKIPVCVGTLLRLFGSGLASGNVRYRRVVGERADKLSYCRSVDSLDNVEWNVVAAAGDGPLMAEGGNQYGTWPPLVELLPLRFTGYHFYRTWPIAPDTDTLRRRWSVLVAADGRTMPLLFKETRDRKVTKTYGSLDGSEPRKPALANLRGDARSPEPTRTTFRSLDRQWCIADARVGDFIRPALWRGWSANQVYLTSLLSGVLGVGPGAMAAAYVPDCHHFRGSYGGKDAIPLWRDAECIDANIAASFIAVLTTAYDSDIRPTDVFAYAYAVLANPGYVERFEEELQVPGLRLPVTKNKTLFDRGAALGRELLRWHTYGERFREKGDKFKLTGSAQVLTAIPGDPAGYPEKHKFDEKKQTLRVGDGEIGSVSPDVFRFSVSGLQVVKSWLDYRMKKGAGKKSSPLDDIRPERWTDEMTRELLELLWVLEWSLAKYPELDAWLDEVLAGPLFSAAEIPPPTDAERKEPKVERGSQTSLPEADDA